MVYRGRPSAGCDVCRLRKIRCDQRRPTCSQCWTAARSCTGYRDQLSLLFQNETAAVIQKVKGADLGPHESSTEPRAEHSIAHQRKRLTRGKSSPEVDDTWRSDQWTYECPSPTFAFTLDRIFQARCFFFNTYSGLTISKRSINGSLSGTSLGKKALTTSIESVGLANLGNLYGQPGLLHSARNKYSLALNQISAALGDPIQATQDTTLAAIICVSFYEVSCRPSLWRHDAHSGQIVTFDRPKPLKAWSMHTQGAAALLAKRGEDQFRREDGLHLFNAVRNEVVKDIHPISANTRANVLQLVDCLQRGERFPETMTHLPGSIGATIEIDLLSTYKNRLITITAKLCNLQAAIREEGPQEASGILSTARAIDTELAEYAIMFVTSFPYKAVTWTESDANNTFESLHIAHFDRRFHFYTSTEACDVWNKYRCARIIVNRLILVQLRRLERRSQDSSNHSSSKDKLHEVESLLKHLAVEICSSVPFKLGIAGKGKNPLPHPESIKPAAGFSLIFPLYLAATVDGYPDPTCLWVMTCLNFFGRFMGINAGLILLGFLPNQKSIIN